MLDIDLLDPKIDFIFKHIFGRQDNRDILAAFLNAILNLSGPSLITAEGIELLNPFLLQESFDDKSGILDIRARLASGKQLNIEIQLASRRDMAERAVYYFSKMFSEQLHAGDDYHELKKTIVIDILNFKLLQDATSYHSVFHLWEDTARFKLTDVAEFHIIELPRLNVLPSRVDTKELQWLLYLKGVGDDVLEGWAMEEPMLKKARTVQEVLSHSREMRYIYEQRRKALLDHTSLVNWAKEEQEARLKAEEALEQERQTTFRAQEALEQERQTTFRAQEALEQERLRADAALEQERQSRRQSARALVMSILTARFPSEMGRENALVPADAAPERLEALIPMLLTSESLEAAVQLLLSADISPPLG